jgi:hypothetical protein
VLDFKDQADVTADVPIYHPPPNGTGARPAFVVETRCVTQAQVEQLRRDCNAVNASAGFLSDQERDERFNTEWRRRSPDLYIKGWRGLTPEALAYLGIATATPPALDAAGCVPYTPEDAQGLWSRAYLDRFSLKIQARARDILEAQAIQERDRKNG